MRDELALLITGDDPPGIEDLLHRPSWQADALCKEHPEVNFFPDPSQSAAPASAVCARCLVASECLSYALSETGIAGVWGGTSDEERRALEPASDSTPKVWSRDDVTRAVRAWLVAGGDERGSAYVGAAAGNRTLPTINVVMRVLGVKSWQRVLAAVAADAAA